MTGNDATDDDRGLPTLEAETTLLYSAPDEYNWGCLNSNGSAPGSDWACLTVTLTETVDEVITRLRQYSGLPDTLAIIAVGETTRSTAATGTSNPLTDHGRSIQTTTVSEVSDLTEIGIRVNQVLKTWEDDGEDIVLCFDSLTPLLQVSDLQRVYRFLHILTSRLKQTGAHSHFHVDPTALAEQKLATLRSLYDETHPTICD